MKNKKIFELYEESFKIRLFEKKLLELFSKGLIKGTTHTCLGQENNATGISSCLIEGDIVLSNHRCHGHFLAHTKNYLGLINEILGKDEGVCKGIGGSQHLFYKKVFYSNGILGGNAPMSLGLAIAKKMQKNNNIVCLFLGDGSFGEGVVYEVLNLISIYKLPILVAIEDNGIAQTTDTSKTISGSIFNKCRSFNIKTHVMDYPDAFKIYSKVKNIIKDVRKGNPNIVILKSTRLGPHSKGDDTRSKSLLGKLNKIDPLKKLKKKLKENEFLKIENESKTFIKKVFDEALTQKGRKRNNLKKLKNTSINKNFDELDVYSKDFKGRRFGELLNHFFHKLAKSNKKILFYGEDIDDPYGGAFKITKNLKTKYPKRVFSTPISEASIVGMASGLAIEGYRPIVEIMFGDFLGLAFDQILNNLSKFYYMYNEDISLPLIIRTPMGGRRGYGPTHSQSIEKHFYGIKGLNIYSLNPFYPINKVYFNAFNNKTPNLIIENKIQYNFILDDLKNTKLKDFKVKFNHDNLSTLLSLSNFETEQCSIICHGGLAESVLDAVHKIYLDKEISCRVILLSKLNPLDNNQLKVSLAKNGPIITIEESSKVFGLGSEIGAILNEDKELKKREFSRISSKDEIIPSSMKKENDVLISTEAILENLNRIFQ